MAATTLAFAACVTIAGLSLDGTGLLIVTFAVTLVWAWSIAFFRDPNRTASLPTDVFCAPADGTIQDITTIDHDRTLGGPAVRIGIFLSLFNVHINRSPCKGRVREIDYRPGLFLAAMNPKASEHNESNTLVIDPDPPMNGPITVKQIAGIAARRIVCHAQPGNQLDKGERFGLIKYGSRTELTVPGMEGVEVFVNVGDKVRAGVTPMLRWPIFEADEGAPNEQHRKNADVAAAAT